MVVKSLFIIEIFLFAAMYLYSFRSGYRKHLSFLFVVSLFLIWLFLSPLYGYLTDVKVLFRRYLWDYYPYVLLEYCIALSSFFIGYLFYFHKKKKYRVEIPKIKNNLSLKFLRIGLLIGVLSFILWGITSGRSLQNIFLLGLLGFGDSNSLFIESKGNVYLLFMIGILTPILTLAFYSKMNKIEFSIWIFITIIIFISQGFRYRILLLLLSFIFLYIYMNRINIRKLFLPLIMLFFSTVLMMQFTNYRNDIRASVSGQHISSFDDRYAKSVGDMLFVSARNYLAFAALLKYMDERDLPFGYGESMFGHIFIRVIPSTFFDNGIKPRPPSVIVANNSWHDTEGSNAGEAYSAVGGAYYEFGTVGVILFFLLFGFFVGVVDKRLSMSKNIISIVFYITIIVSFFQLVTRGYFPAYVMTIGFMLLPFVYLKFVNKRHRKMNV